MSLPFVDLRAVQSYKDRQKFLARHWTPARIALLCFTAGLVVMFLVASLVHVITR